MLHTGTFITHILKVMPTEVCGEGCLCLAGCVTIEAKVSPAMFCADLVFYLLPFHPTSFGEEASFVLRQVSFSRLPVFAEMHPETFL